MRTHDTAGNWGLADYDYSLPHELIAQEPLAIRDASRMLVLRRPEGSIEHSIFRSLPKYLLKDDLLVLNDTRVIPARLEGFICERGGDAEILLLHPLPGNKWAAMARPGRKLRKGTEVRLAEGISVKIEAELAGGLREISFTAPCNTGSLLRRFGKVPLPPYITTPIAEPDRYQTVYAAHDGSAAAPTAGFHFTDRVFAALQAQGVDWVYITLHIGPGTFQPVKADDIREHRMHAEAYKVGIVTADRLNKARVAGRRIVAVGTTVCRVLEAVADHDGVFAAREGWTELFIYPGYNFRAVDALLTNFHLPRSTLLMLVSAFAGREKTLNAYREAVRERYRFYSFGDCMLIL